MPNVPSKQQARESALYSLLLQVSVGPILPGWWLKYAWMQMLRALTMPVRCQWGTLPRHHVARHVPMGAEQARFSPHRTLLWCKFVVVKKCQCTELICLLWQSVEQERAPVALSGLRCRKVSEPRAMLVLRDAARSLPPSPRTTAALGLRLCARDPCNPPSTLQTCSQKLAGKGEGEKGCLRYPRELCFLW